MIKLARGHADDRTARAVRVALTIGILVLSVALLSPFVSPLLWAGVLCYALNPVYVWLVKASGGGAP